MDNLNRFTRKLFVSKNAASNIPSIDECLTLLDANSSDPSTLPFTCGDVTAGTENELQVAVEGDRRHVDLPQVIETSNYFANIFRRIQSGDTSSQAYRNIERYLNDNHDNTWENSWVRFPCRHLNDKSRSILLQDLKANKNNPDTVLRGDSDRFFFQNKGEPWLRVPVSYLLKLALADLLGEKIPSEVTLQSTGHRIMEHFLSDNTSPETYSFYVVSGRDASSVGNAVARETAKRYLFSQLLLQYANSKFALEENGQKGLLFFSPHPPIRQRYLNENISDAFYRELFMSPCLAGWNDGEEKHQYMGLCHQVLSRSQMNAVMKLREAGVITYNLVVLPQTSNISLANNGTHISLGSRKLTGLLENEVSGFTSAHEKYLGDLAAKIMEHFLPLLVGTYSAAPYRIPFEDFHPEKVLGFLPHQLDYTHLRMFWRRWKKKARNKIFGHALTPFGPLPMDSFISRLFGLQGDFLPDFRLLDYPVSLLSTERNCCQDGVLGNDLRLKQDLDDLGVFDKRMSLYQLIKLREQKIMGFSGFEARYYSLFENFESDLGHATDLQMLLNALAFKLILHQKFNHQHIPSSPFIESERRQIIFGSAVGLPTFFVHKNTQNIFLLRILAHTNKIRPSLRYPGYLRVHNLEYRLALIKFIKKEGADLIEMLQLKNTINDLEKRLLFPDTHSTCGKLVRSIVGSDMSAKAHFKMTAHEFNTAAEKHYRHDLRLSHMNEAWEFLTRDICSMARGTILLTLETRELLATLTEGMETKKYLDKCREEIITENISLNRIKNLIRLMLLSINIDTIKEKTT